MRSIRQIIAAGAGIYVFGASNCPPDSLIPAKPVAGMFFYLDLIVASFSRKIVGWEVHACESADLAAALIQKAVWAEACIARPLVLHADPNSRTGAAQ